MALFDQVKEFEPVNIPMRDGANLLGDLYVPDYIPDGMGPYPTLVRMTPYPRRRRGLHSEIQYAVAHGYAVLIVSNRGRFGSDRESDGEEGSAIPTDGFDTIEWAASQSWSTGRVGTFGISSDGQWQLYAATQRPPHLKAMFVSYPANSRDGRITNGVYTSTGIGWHALNDAFARPLQSLADWEHWLDDWQASELPMLTSFINPALLGQFEHPPNDEYWPNSEPSLNFDQVDVPVLLECGWYDRYVRWSLQAFSDLRAKSSEATRPHHKLVMGPWLHGGTVPSAPDPAAIPDIARVDRRALHMRWFDQWLKEENTGALEDPPVKFYLMSEHRWIESETWPPSGVTLERLYLRAGSESNGQSLNDGRLLPDEPDEGEESDLFEHDPYHPVLTIGGHGGVGRWWPGGPLDQRPVEARSLTFSTPVLEKDLVVTGEVRAHIYFSSTAKDTDFILTLSDVYPDGYSAIISQTPISARYRVPGEDRPLNPREVFDFEFAFPSIANAFKAGHCLRLAIASSSFPAYIPNAGTGEPPHLATKALTASNRIFHEKRFPSNLELPVHR